MKTIEVAVKILELLQEINVEHHQKIAALEAAKVILSSDGEAAD